MALALMKNDEGLEAAFKEFALQRIYPEGKDDFSKRYNTLNDQYLKLFEKIKEKAPVISEEMLDLDSIVNSMECEVVDACYNRGFKDGVNFILRMLNK